MIEYVGGFIDGLGTIEYLLVMIVVALVALSVATYLDGRARIKQLRAANRILGDKLVQPLEPPRHFVAKEPHVSGVAMDGQCYRHYTIEELMRP